MLFLTACGGLPSSPDPNPTQALAPTLTPTRMTTPTPTATERVFQPTISIWHAWDESQIPVLVQIIHNFSEEHPEILFDVLYVPIEDLRTRFEVEVRQGGGPDILLAPSSWGPPFFDTGLLLDISDLADEEMLNTLNPPVLESAFYNGALIGLPHTIQGVVLYRNKNIIPTRVTTFEELVSLAQSATQGEQIGAILKRNFLFAGGHLEGIGGRLMDDEGLPAFNNTKGVEWLELLSAFELAGPPVYAGSTDVEAFKEGRVGWIIDGTWNMEDISDVVGAEGLAIDPWPAYGDGILSGYVQSESVFLNQRVGGSPDSAAWIFAQYFLSAEAQVFLPDVRRIPASTNTQVVNVTTGHLINQAMAALAGGVAYPIIPEMDVYALQLDIALKSYYDGAPAANVLQAADDTISEQLLVLRITPTAPPTATP